MAGKRVLSGVTLSWPKPNFVNTKRTNKNFNGLYRGALMYAHYELSNSDLKKESLKFLKTNSPSLYERARECNEFLFSTVGKYFYILNHGGEIPEDMQLRLVPTIEKILDEEEKKVAKEESDRAFAASQTGTVAEVSPDIEVVRVTVQDRLRDRAREVAGEIEGWLDDFILDKKSSVKTIEEFVSLFKAMELKSPHMRHMVQIFQKRKDEVSLALEGKDKDLSEGYSNFTKPELKKLDLFYSNIMSACDMMQEAAKAVRAPKKKKPVSQEKLVSKIKYKKEDATLGVASINPIQMLGAKEVWVYNTKTRKLAQYKALDIAGIMVKGSSLLNFSSESKEKTLRKPVETLADFKKASKIKLRAFLDELSTVDTTPTGKLNEHHIILRVDK